MVYFGKGGFTHSDVYDMPVQYRKLYVDRLIKTLEKQNGKSNQMTEKTARSRVQTLANAITPNTPPTKKKSNKKNSNLSPDGWSPK